MRIIRKSEFTEGRWRNGMGVSWDIASDPPDAGASGFGWRFAIARIDADVPFSHYPDVDRVFTLIAGQGLSLDFAGGKTLEVNDLFVPHPYPCDVAIFCRLRDGPCRALNLFWQRSTWRAEVEIFTSRAGITHSGPILLFALDSGSQINGQVLNEGDAAIAEEHVTAAADGARLFAARLFAAKTPASHQEQEL